MTSPLVSTAWLQQNLQDPAIRIIELRGKVLPPTAPPPHYLSDRAGFEAAHIPGAVYADWQVDFVEPGSPTNDIAAPERFAALMSRLGVDSGSMVIISDDAGSMFACRLRWALRYYGHEAVSVLDGGWQKWRAESRPISSESPPVAPGNFIPQANPRLIASADAIRAALGDSQLQLIDTRSPAEFAGSASRAKHGGHIPGAINLPRGALVAEDMTLKPAAEIRARLESSGIALDAPDTVLYCNTGVSATFGMLAMELAGATNLRIYDSSWKEWGNDETTPKARA